MHLRDYLKPKDGKRIPASVLAEEIGVAHTTVLRWADGTIQPGAEALRKIHAATGGAVTPNDMLGLDAA